MENVKAVLVNYAVCALLGSIFEFISPRKSKETFRIVSSIILLSVIVIPLATLDFTEMIEEISVDYEETNEADTLLHTANLMEKELYNKIENILINQGVDEYEIYISTEIDKEANEIVLTEIKLLVDDKFRDKIPDLERSLSGEFKEILKIGVKNEN